MPDSFHSIVQQDALRIVQANGEQVLFTDNQGVAHELTAIIFRNAIEEPPIGYVGTISSLANEIGFALLDFQHIPRPQRDDVIHFDDRDHRVLFVLPTDDTKLLVYTS